jgi:HK97 family phage major capsid protein
MEHDYSDVKSAIEATCRAFEEFKKTNDERVRRLEKGNSDSLVDAKLSRIEKELDQLEKINQELTLSKQNEKNIKEQLDNIETMIKRPAMGLTHKQVDRKMEVFSKWLRKGKENLDRDEVKALTVGDDTQAGFLAPPEYVAELIKTVTEISPVRQVARVRTTSQRSIQMPSRTATFAASWVAETGTRSETTGYTTQLEEIPTHELYALVDISEALLEDSVFNLESEMSTEFAEQFAKAEGAAFTTGNSIGKPEGFTTNTGASTTGGSGVVTADTLMTLVHAIKTEYGRNAIFAFNRTTLGAIRKLKDTAGQYIFQPGMSGIAGVPNTILGYPYVEMPDMADVASSAKCIVFGDFRAAYTIVDRIQLSILRDPFTQATSGNVRYVARKRVGGQVVLPEAIQAYVPS